jgi:V/A-type H+-transporting ATPase subunit I
MGLARVEKVLIAVHRNEEDKFLSQIQEQGILHIVKTETTPTITELGKETKLTAEPIGEAINYLESFTEKKGLLAGLIGTQPAVESEELKRTIATYDAEQKILKLKTLRQQIQDIEAKEKAIAADIAFLSPWRKLDYDLAEIYSARLVEMILGIFPAKEDFLKAQGAIQELPVHLEVINQDTRVYCLVVLPKDKSNEIKSLLLNHHFEIVDFSNCKGKPAVLIEQLTHRQKELNQKREQLVSESLALASELPKLKILYDYYLNQQQRQALGRTLAKTNSVLFIEGWIRRLDFKKLEKIIENSDSAVMERIEPNPGEAPPVALQNRRFFRPFEIVLEMYGMPAHFEIDPTPLLTPWFLIFFALCLADVGYGILLAVISFLLLKKMGADNKLLKVFIVAGIVTIFAGALTGGWFGDIVDKLGLSFLTTIRNRILLFDPIKNPMPFFVLSIVLGYLQVLFGILIEIYDSFRQGNAGGAIFEQLPWFLLLNSLVGFFLTGKYIPVSYKPIFVFIILLASSTIIIFTRRRPKLTLTQVLLFFILLGGLLAFGGRLKLLPPIFLNCQYLSALGFLMLVAIAFREWLKSKKGTGIIFLSLFMVSTILYFLIPLPLIIPIIVGTLFIFSEPQNQSNIKKIVWGIYSLYGASSYIGLVLSYIRLMALGMSGAGIAMAINTIAWMVIKIPVLGIILAIIILVFGHIYNLAVNILGAFVHTLRLQYVEFFPRFFTGGGEKFTPFQWQNKYIKVK